MLPPLTSPGFRAPARRRLSMAVIALLVLGLAGLSAGRQPADAYPESHVKLTGHGWGHGRGMGQYGSLGYALAGWDYGRILAHYYSNTTPGDIGNPGIRVHLTRFDGKDTIVFQERGQGTVDGEGGTWRAMRAARSSTTGLVQVYVADDCGGGGGWRPIGAPKTEVRFRAPNTGDDRGSMLQTCEVGRTTWYRGAILAVNGGGARTVNELDVNSYLRGVVPRESPASWGGLGGGAGMHALRAQAVAARSYAWAENRSSWAKTCDTISCQVYGGRAQKVGAGEVEDLEPAATNAAVAETSGQVRILNGTVARTEFSSSTGGWTAGGTFPAVVDEGDAIAQNPNHTWTASVAVSAIEGAYPEIGRLKAVDVTGRNGLGDWGGRVTAVTLRGTSADRTISGNEFRSRFGLRSDWFLVNNNVSGGVAGYWAVGHDGGVFSFGEAPFYGSTGGMRLNRPIVGMAAAPAGNGYWMVATDGGIFAFGPGAAFHGSTGSMRLNQPIVGMAPTPAGDGYWLVASDGGIFAFGNARFHGSTGSMRLNQPIVGMAPTASGNGYWLVARDGGIFAFGDARFHGSTGSMRLAQPVVGMAARPDGQGYWLVAGDGGIFAFNAPFLGSLPGIGAGGPAVGIRPTRTGGGYLVATGPGRIYNFGDAPYFGDVRQVIPGYSGTLRALDVKPA